jgi:hypothetical protein
MTLSITAAARPKLSLPFGASSHQQPRRSSVLSSQETRRIVLERIG